MHPVNNAEGGEDKNIGIADRTGASVTEDVLAKGSALVKGGIPAKGSAFLYTTGSHVRSASISTRCYIEQLWASLDSALTSCSYTPEYRIEWSLHCLT